MIVLLQIHMVGCWNTTMDYGVSEREYSLNVFNPWAYKKRYVKNIMCHGSTVSSQPIISVLVGTEPWISNPYNHHKNHQLIHPNRAWNAKYLTSVHVRLHVYCSPKKRRLWKKWHIPVVLAQQRSSLPLEICDDLELHLTEFQNWDRFFFFE